MDERITSNYVRPHAASPLPRESLVPDWTFGSQVRVSIHGHDHMKVCWIALDSQAQSIVDYSTQRGRYDHTATGTHRSYTYGSYTSGEIHTVIIGPLFPDTTYFYRVGGVPCEFSLKTPPPVGPDGPNVVFAVVGDLGQTNHTKSTLGHVRDSSYDVLILPGDLSYADLDHDQARWDSFGQLVTPLASSRPWMVTEGNHDKERWKGHDHIEDFRAYNARWEMPYALSGSESNLYYSFDVAGVHWVMLGSYAHKSKSSPQYKWLRNDLDNVDRSKTPWLIAVVHKPWYTSNKAHDPDEHMREAMEELLYKAKTDIMFAGHIHAYERSVRTYEEKSDDNGIIHITIGDGGNREGLTDKWWPQPDWSAFREASFGHGQLKIMNGGTAEWTWHRNDDGENVCADRVIIKSLSRSER